MPCSVTLAGIGIDCSTNLSGIKNLYLADYNEVASVTLTTDHISAITMKETAKFYKYTPAKNTGSLTKTLTKDESTGVKYYTNEVVAQFNRMDGSKRAELDQLDGAQLAGIVEDMNGILWYLGYDNYATASAITGQTGAGMDDGNFYSLTVTDISGQLPYPVDSSILSGLIA